MRFHNATITLYFLVISTTIAPGQSGPNANILVPITPSSTISDKETASLRNEVQTLKGNLDNKKEELKRVQRQAETSQAEAKRLLGDVKRLQTQIQQVSQDFQKAQDAYELKVQTLTDDFTAKRQKLTQSLDEAYSIIRLQDSVITAIKTIVENQIAEIEYLKAVRSDHVNTQDNQITIGGNTKPYRSLKDISGFITASDHLPRLSEEEKDYLKRLVALANTHNLKINLTGTCKYENIEKGMAEDLARRRAISLRNHLVNDLGLRSDLVESDGTSKCDVCNTVRIRVHD